MNDKKTSLKKTQDFIPSRKELVEIVAEGIAQSPVIVDLSKRIGNQEVKGDNLGVKVDRLEVKIDSLEVKVDRLEVKVDSLEVKFDRLEVKVESYETRFDKIETHLLHIDAELAHHRDIFFTKHDFYEFKDQLYTKLDSMMSILVRLDQEGLFINKKLDNHEQRLHRLELA